MHFQIIIACLLIMVCVDQNPAIAGKDDGFERNSVSNGVYEGRKGSGRPNHEAEKNNVDRWESSPEENLFYPRKYEVPKSDGDFEGLYLGSSRKRRNSPSGSKTQKNSNNSNGQNGKPSKGRRPVFYNM